VFVVERERFTDRAISQNVRLLGCICKNVKTVIIVVEGPDLCANLQKKLERTKRPNTVCDIAALKKKQ
jgi:hypothetical protein